MWSLYLSLDIELIRSALGQLAKWIWFDCLELFTSESQSHPIQECPNSTWWAGQIDNSPMSTNIMPLSSSCYVSVACCLFWERVWFLWMGYPHRIQLYMWMLPRTSPSGVGMSQNWWLSQPPLSDLLLPFSHLLRNEHYVTSNRLRGLILCLPGYWRCSLHRLSH